MYEYCMGRIYLSRKKVRRAHKEEEAFFIFSP